MGKINNNILADIVDLDYTQTTHNHSVVGDSNFVDNNYHQFHMSRRIVDKSNSKAGLSTEYIQDYRTVGNCSMGLSDCSSSWADNTYSVDHIGRIGYCNFDNIVVTDLYNSDNNLGKDC